MSCKEDSSLRPACMSQSSDACLPRVNELRPSPLSQANSRLHTALPSQSYNLYTDANQRSLQPSQYLLLRLTQSSPHTNHLRNIHPWPKRRHRKPCKYYIRNLTHALRPCLGDNSLLHTRLSALLPPRFHNLNWGIVCFAR